jgi:hypothetical protein
MVGAPASIFDGWLAAERKIGFPMGVFAKSRFGKFPKGQAKEVWLDLGRFGDRLWFG